MSQRVSVVAFLKQNEEFTLNILEHIESARCINYAKKKYKAFCKSFSDDYTLPHLWQRKRRQMEQILQNVPAYLNIDWEREDFWESIPVIDKSTICAQPEKFLNRLYDQKRLWCRESSGTTRPPVPIWYAPEFFSDYHLFSAYKVAWLTGALTKDLRKNPVFCLVLADNKGLASRIWTAPENKWGLTLLSFYDEGALDSAEKFITLLNRYNPAILSTKPDILESILGRITNAARVKTGRLKFIITAGTNLEEHVRRSGEKFFGVPIYNVYSMSEFGTIASECAYKDGLHLFEQDIIPEVLTKEGICRDTGKGELVVSSIANSAMPLLRYRTGDLVEVISEPCPCGRRGRRIRNIMGRLVHYFRLTDGSEFAPTNLNRLCKLFPIREFRLTQIKINEIRAEIELMPTCKQAGETLISIRKFIECEMRSLVKVDIVQLKFNYKQKFQRYRNHL